jgi:hypothetical protein
LEVEAWYAISIGDRNSMVNWWFLWLPLFVVLHALSLCHLFSGACAYDLGVTGSHKLRATYISVLLSMTHTPVSGETQSIDA